MVWPQAIGSGISSSAVGKGCRGLKEGRRSIFSIAVRTAAICHPLGAQGIEELHLAFSARRSFEFGLQCVDQIMRCQIGPLLAWTEI